MNIFIYNCCMLFFFRVYELVNYSLATMDDDSNPAGGSAKLTRRMTIDEDDFVDFEYELDDKKERVVLGRGSFGTVYSAIDLVTKRKMAVKEIPEKIDGCVHTKNMIHVYKVDPSSERERKSIL